MCHHSFSYYREAKSSNQFNSNNLRSHVQKNLIINNIYSFSLAEALDASST